MLLSHLKQRLLGIVLIIAIAIIWVLFSATPVLAQENAVNYTYSEIRGKDFSHQNLVGGVFAAAGRKRCCRRRSETSATAVVRIV